MEIIAQLAKGFIEGLSYFFPEMVKKFGNLHPDAIANDTNVFLKSKKKNGNYDITILHKPLSDNET